MNKFLIVLLGLGLGLLLSFGNVHAECTGANATQTASSCTNYCDYVNNTHCEMPTNSVCYCNPLTGTGLESITNPIIDFMFKISIVVVPVLVTYGAFMIVTSAGDETKVKQAKAIIYWSLIGFGIVLLSRGISDLISKIIGI